MDTFYTTLTLLKGIHNVLVPYNVLKIISILELIKEHPLQLPSFLSLCSQWKGTVPSLFPGGPGFEKMGESRLIVKELLTICLQRVMVEESARITEQGETSCGLTMGLWVIIWSLPAPRFCIHLFQR